MTTEREKLATAVGRAITNASNYPDRTAVNLLGRDLSKLIAAVTDSVEGSDYRKPREVTTAEELDALPFESVVRDAGGYVLERWGPVEEKIWVCAGNPVLFKTEDIDLPATVLDEGDR